MAPILSSIRRWIDRRRGDSVVTDLSPYQKRLTEIGTRARRLSGLDDGRLVRLSGELRERATKATSTDDLEIDAFALVREASSRTLGLEPFDVQVLAGLAMNRGNVIEMQTGEG